VPAQGWFPDPAGAHEERWFSAGRFTPLVRDHGVEGREDLPPDQQPGVRDLAAGAVKLSAEPYYWSYWTVALPCLVAFAAAGLIVGCSLAFQPTEGFGLAGTAVAWVQAGWAGQIVACLATAALLIAAAQRKRWRKGIALTVWGVLLLQFVSFLLVSSQYPGNSCAARPGWAALTLSDDSRAVVTVAPGAYVAVTVPGWWTGSATDVGVYRSGLLREDCTIPLPAGGRRTIFTAIKPGATGLQSDVEPASPLFMPGWDGGVIVRGGAGLQVDAGGAEAGGVLLVQGGVGADLVGVGLAGRRVGLEVHVGPVDEGGVALQDGEPVAVADA
jgi:hypothetical protein